MVVNLARQNDRVHGAGRRAGGRARGARVRPCVGTAAGAAVVTVPFPGRPGADALFKVCGNCHGPESVLGQLKTHDEWRKTLDEMATNGAEGPDGEWTQIQACWTSTTPDLHQQGSREGSRAPLDVAPSVAEAIVRRRTETGAYKSIDDLKQVPGVTASAIEARKDRLIL